MDRKFKFLLFFSVLLHIFIIIILLYFLSINNLRLKFSEEKKVTLTMQKISKKTLLKNINSKNSLSHSKSNDLSEYREEIKKNVKIENEVKLNVKSSDNIYQYSNIYVRKHNIEEIDIFSDFKTAETYNEDDVLKDYGEYLSFTDGEKRELINDYKNEFLSLDLDFNISCRFKILIDNNGLVKSVVIVESTGNIEKDNMISRIISKWQFNASSNLNSEAVVELRYLFK